MRPVIGVTTFMAKKPRKTYACVSNSYLQSIEKAGGIPLMLPLTEVPEVMNGYLDIIDGLVISGGDEGVNPRLYGENPVKELACICPTRDEYEMYLFAGALEKKIPVLGVCRGMQLINVAGGGSLYQDVFTQRTGTFGHLPVQMPVDVLYHSVSITRGSVLESIFATDELMVNSFHHQAVKKLAPSFAVAALSEDNLIEAIEHQGHDFVLGVQWHPEDLTEKHVHFLKLFEAFVAAARKN